MKRLLLFLFFGVLFSSITGAQITDPEAYESNIQRYANESMNFESSLIACPDANYTIKKKCQDEYYADIYVKYMQVYNNLTEIALRDGTTIPCYYLVSPVYIPNSHPGSQECYHAVFAQEGLAACDTSRLTTRINKRVCENSHVNYFNTLNEDCDRYTNSFVQAYCENKASFPLQQETELITKKVQKSLGWGFMVLLFLFLVFYYNKKDYTKFYSLLTPSFALALSFFLTYILIINTMECWACLTIIPIIFIISFFISKIVFNKNEKNNGMKGILLIQIIIYLVFLALVWIVLGKLPDIILRLRGVPPIQYGI